MRERVEAAVAGSLLGAEVVEAPPGWSADEMLEQVALHAAMHFMFGELNPASKIRVQGNPKSSQA